MRLTNKIRILALASQGIIILLGLGNLILNKELLSQNDLGRYYLLSSTLLLKELFSSGVVQNFMIRLSKNKNGRVEAVLVNSFASYFIKRSGFLFLFANIYAIVVVADINFWFSVIFSFTLVSDFVTLWYYPYIEATGRLNSLYISRTVAYFISYLASWVVLFQYRSLTSLIIFLLVFSLFKMIFIFILFKQDLRKFSFVSRIPLSFINLQKKINLSFYANLIHKLSLFPLVSSISSLETVGSFGILNSLFSSASTFSREIIRSNLSKQGKLLNDKTKAVREFMKNLLLSITIYFLCISAVMIIISFTGFSDDLNGFTSLFWASLFYFFGLYVANQVTWLHRLFDREPLRWLNVLFLPVIFLSSFYGNTLEMLETISIFALILAIVGVIIPFQYINNQIRI